MKRVKRPLFSIYRLVLPPLRRAGLDRMFKHAYEYAFWVKEKRRESILTSAGYEGLFTELVGVSRETYSGARVLDIGCGPRGTLEWLGDGQARVGLDPLVNRYRRLGIDAHAMTYVNARSEAMPFDDASFDVVASINSLDHVDDVDRTITEIKRVTAPGGLFLLIVDVHARPTIAEPHALGWDVVAAFKPEFSVVEELHLESEGGGPVAALRQRIPYRHDNPVPRYGVLMAKLRREA